MHLEWPKFRLFSSFWEYLNSRCSKFCAIKIFVYYSINTCTFLVIKYQKAKSRKCRYFIFTVIMLSYLTRTGSRFLNQFNNCYLLLIFLKNVNSWMLNKIADIFLFNSRTCWTPWCSCWRGARLGSIPSTTRRLWTAWSAMMLTSSLSRHVNTFPLFCDLKLAACGPQVAHRGVAPSFIPRRWWPI